MIRIEDIRFPILEYKDNKIDAKELINKLEKLINKYEQIRCKRKNLIRN